MFLVTLLQTNIQWAQPDENMRRAEALIAANGGSDLYVLPEMWATGFATTPMEVPIDEKPLLWMQRMARQYDCAIAGSLATHTAEGEYRNRHYFVTPLRSLKSEGGSQTSALSPQTSALTYYDKHHLFTYGHEDQYFTPGSCHTIVEWRGVRILLLTCYDLRFPLWARYGQAGEYDMIVCAANWPESRQQPWRILTRARAIENQCYLVGVNRVGDDAFCHYCGESLVCDSRGNTLAECAANSEEAVTVALDFDALNTVRERFRVLDDRD